jgi:hypothetical protein
MGAIAGTEDEAMKDMINDEHQAEAEERWGTTEQYRQSSKRTASYGEEQWKKIRAELDDIEADFADALEQGVPTDGDEAAALAERARMHIDRWYYDDRREGLAEYVAAAIKSNAVRHG